MKKIALRPILNLCDKIDRHTNVDTCDEYCFYANTKCYDMDAADVREWRYVIKDIDKTIREFEKDSAKYVAKLKVLRDNVASRLESGRG